MNNNMPLISVIVPVYNVQDYLEKCFDSIKSNSYENLEIILVNDGSTDKCGEMCESFKESDSRVKVVNKPNGGLSSARNAGLEIANGDYISFIDSDDYIAHDMMEKLVVKAEEYNADVVQCGYCKVNESGKTLDIVSGDSFFLDDNKKILDSFFVTNKYQVVVWNKLYRKEVVKNIRFIEGKNNEDNMFEADILPKINRVYFLNDICYMYLQRESSIMGGTFSHKKMDSFFALKYMMEKCQESYPEYICYVHKLVCLNVFYLDYLLSNQKNKKEFINDRKIMLSEFRDNWKMIKNKGILTGIDKFRLELYSVCPKLSFFMYSLVLNVKVIKRQLFRSTRGA